jgi:hypothetical protein
MEEVIQQARAVLSVTPARWKSLAGTLPGELLNRPPAPGEWSAVQCLQHLVDTEQAVFAARVRFLLAEQDFPAFDPDSQGTVSRAGTSPFELAGDFERRRLESLALLTEVKIEDLEKRARHAELGPVTLSELLHEWAAHDLMHTVQAERALMQPFIQGCGPWQVYFSDHLAQPK